MPVSHVLTLERPVKPFARAERGEQRFLHDVLGEVGVAQLQLGDPHEIAAVPVQFGGEERGVQGEALPTRPRREY